MCICCILCACVVSYVYLLYFYVYLLYLCVFVVPYMYLLYLMCICCILCLCVLSYVYLLYFYVYFLYLCVFVILLCVFVVRYVYLLYSYVYFLYYVCIDFLTLDAGLLARSQYPEGPATGQLDTGFFLISLCLQANAEMVPKFPSYYYMPLT